jgi:hypothetical protein
MTAEGIKTPTDIKQIEMQLGETKMMIPVTMKAIEKALTDLTEFLVRRSSLPLCAAAAAAAAAAARV